ncbi:hypothetical protein ACPOLB_26760 [Rubrivivax sp. RP6-9]|uniref:hypothetical protein n=1 Tax=Rubrivivax sp. RP6-9 TaxID=3415750 RepID=UPI003CC672A7
MHTDRPLVTKGARFELRYRGLFNPGRGYTFPCDAQGRVELDRLSESARVNYLFARATVGIELAAPVVLVVQ